MAEFDRAPVLLIGFNRPVQARAGEGAAPITYRDETFAEVGDWARAAAKEA